MLRLDSTAAAAAAVSQMTTKQVFSARAAPSSSTVSNFVLTTIKSHTEAGFDSKAKALLL